MFMNIIEWWYGDGFKKKLAKLRNQLLKTTDFFSFDILVKTLFNPFRQISANQVNGSIEVEMRAFFDKLISRIIGFNVRLVVMFAGIVCLLLQMIWSIVEIIFWLLTPGMPIVGLILTVLNWTIKLI